MILHRAAFVSWSASSLLFGQSQKVTNERVIAIKLADGRVQIWRLLPGGGHSCPPYLFRVPQPYSNAAGQECPASLGWDTFQPPDREETAIVFSLQAGVSDLKLLFSI